MEHQQDFNLITMPDGQEIQFIEKDGEPWFTAEEVGKHLGYADPSRSVHRIYNRHLNEIRLFSVVVKLTTTDGKDYDMRVFNEEGVYLLSMHADTAKASEFRVNLAILLKRLREQRIEVAKLLAAQEARREIVGRVLSVPRERLDLCRKAAYYRDKGLTFREVGKLLDCHKDTARHAYAQARQIGLVEEAPNE